MRTTGNFTRDEWNHLLCLFNISHFSSTVCSDTLAKRSHQDSGEERVTAKSRPMMNLVSRTPSLVSSSTSVSPGKRSYGSQNSMEFYWWSSITEEDRSGRLDKGTDIFWSLRSSLPWAIHGKLLFSKSFKIGWRPCVVFSRLENWDHEIRAIGATC